MPLGSDGLTTGSMELIALGSLVINNADGVLVPVIGTGTIELAPPTGYVQLTEGSEANYIDRLNKLSIGNGQVVIGDVSDGSYILDIHAYFDCSHNNANNAHVGIAVSLERNSVVTFRDRQIHGKLPNNADITNFAGLGIVGGDGEFLQTGDILGLHLASDTTGNIEIHTANVAMRLWRVIS